jgi:hypothetical protein
MRTIGDVYLDVKPLGFTFEQVLAPGALSRKSFDVREGDIMRVSAVDGNAFVTVTGFTDDGFLMVEPDRVPTPKRGPGRPPKGDE